MNLIINKTTKKVTLATDTELGASHPLNSIDLAVINAFVVDNFSMTIPKNRSRQIVGWLASDIIEGNWTALKEKRDILSSVLNREINQQDYDDNEMTFFVNDAYRVLYS